MELPVRDQVRYWGIAALLFLAALWFLGGVILPFVVGGAIAYFLDPVADRLERLGLSRTLATATITLVALLVLVVALLLVIPALVGQAVDLAEAAPELVQDAMTELTKYYPDLIEADSPIRRNIAGLAEMMRDRLLPMVDAVLSSALGVVGFFVFILVVPVVAFYLLLDWDRMVAQVDALLPRDHAPTVRRLAREIDAVLAGFVRGQLTVCAILGTFYATGLVLVGLDFGLVVGATAGLISFIPYVGVIVGGALAMGLAVYQFWSDPLMIGAVAAVFVAGQVLEGNFLVPKLVGGSVGLHPVWLLFALSAFGSVFGFVGMLVAVPVAAALGVLARFGVQQYSASLLYRGAAGRAEAAAAPDPDAAAAADRSLPVVVSQPGGGDGGARP
jgi:predicted PurR-regulated permease PerM